LIFDNTTANIKLTIKNIYKGTKYNDTCISAIIPHLNYYKDDSVEYKKNEITNAMKNYRKLESARQTSVFAAS
jgi:glutaredoxin-related protein